MRLLKQALAVLGTVTMIAVLIAVVAPKAAHGVVAALVQVTNTPANPVNTLAADAATAFVEQNRCTFVENGCTVGSLYVVPAGQIAVVESLSGACDLDPGAGEEAIEFQLGYNNPSGSFVTASIAPGPVFQFPIDGLQSSVGGENFRTYVSAGPISATAITGNFELNSLDACVFTLSGHLVTP